MTSASERSRADFLSFADVAVARSTARLPEIDRPAMEMVLLLHRVASTVVYDLESRVHRPAGWSWSAFRVLFTVWVAGPSESRRVATLSGMSRAAVSSLAKTLGAAGLLTRTADSNDGRSVILSLTDRGTEELEAAYHAHNAREVQWAGLLGVDEVATLTALLAKLAGAAQCADWVNHRM